MPEMQETTSTSESIYTDLERKEEKIIAKNELITDTSSSHSRKVMTASNDNSNMATINSTVNMDRVQLDPNQTTTTTTTTNQVPTNMNTSTQPPVANRPTKRSANDFRFGKSIGEGSFSTVYLAKDIHTNKEYASKFPCLQIYIYQSMM